MRPIERNIYIYIHIYIYDQRKECFREKNRKEKKNEIYYDEQKEKSGNYRVGLIRGGSREWLSGISIIFRIHDIEMGNKKLDFHGKIFVRK
ncbi:MAG: hypothetical protein Q8807_03855 ['Waltheria sp.' little leaf phytoplasma]|nr:hypothetical protein ['Waltheria sp.' little leaf phytoplasma]